MNAAVHAQMNAPAHVAGRREAARWITRQLRWERTLETLRGERRSDAARRAA